MEMEFPSFRFFQTFFQFFWDLVFPEKPYMRENEREREVGPLGRKFKMRERLYAQGAQLSFYLLFFFSF